MDNAQRLPVGEENEEVVLYIRDRRRAKQYIVDNLVMDHWFPIIGETGYAIYSLLVRMSHSEEEKASVGFSTICEHLATDDGRSSKQSGSAALSRNTVTYYISLLEHCALIYRDKPEIIEVNPNTGEEKRKRQGNRSNTYYILDVQEVNEGALQNIKAAIGKDSSIPAKYRRIFNGRIDRWKSIQQVWSGSKRRRIKTVIGQPSLFVEPDPPTPAEELTEAERVTGIRYVPGVGGPR